MQAEIRAQVRHNSIVNITDAAFFGLGMGFASFVTIIPLFAATLTDSTLLIGLIASSHAVGWQLPQVLTSNRVAQLSRYKPMVLLMTLHERLPFFGLALVALFAPRMGKELALLLTFVMAIWQSIGGGLTATAWQTMIAKIIPMDRRGTFYGMQSSLSNLLGSGAAVAAGVILEIARYPDNFALCFFICGLAMMVSLGFLAQTREPATPVSPNIPQGWKAFSKGLAAIMQRDKNFRWFVTARMLAHVAAMATSFYTIYAVRQFGMSGQMAGTLTGILMLSQVVANPLLGHFGDRFGHRLMFAIGALIYASAALLALAATSLNWFYVVFALAGFASATLWTTAMALNSEFGGDAERPYYLGLGNTLIAPATLIAPIVGGLLADTLGFGAAFIVAAFCGLLTAMVLAFAVRDPRTVQLAAAHN